MSADLCIFADEEKKQMKLKDLKIAYNVLAELDYDVPNDLLVLLADTIRDKEQRQNERRLSRMTEEDLIKHQNKQKRKLRINTIDGRLIHKRTNEETFRSAFAELDMERVVAMNLQLRGKPPIVEDITNKRKRQRGYALIKPGYFVLAKSSGEEKLRILGLIDEELQLNWDIITL